MDDRQCLPKRTLAKLMAISATAHESRMDANEGHNQTCWSAVAERSGDTAFRGSVRLRKRRGGLLPSALHVLADCAGTFTIVVQMPRT